MSSSSTSVLLEQPSSELRVVEVDPHTDPRWLAFVQAHPEGSVYHHPAWLKVLELEYGQKSLYLACEDTNGELRAILPMLYTRGLPINVGAHLTKRRLSSLPRTPISGPLSLERRATAALIEAAVSEAKRDSVSLQIKTQGPELDGCLQGSAVVPWRLSYVLPLPQDSSQPYRIPEKHSRNTVKCAVRKAQRLGMQVRAAKDEADLATWYQLYLKTMRKHFLPPRPYRFFRALWEQLQPLGMMELLLAELQTQDGTTPVAGYLFLIFNRTVHCAFNGADPEHLSLRPNDIILWHAIHQMAERGYEFLDLGEVPENNPGLARFKSKWGTQQVRLYRLRYPAWNETERGTEESDSNTLLLINAIWNRVPLRVTAWVGDLVYCRL